MMNKDEALAMLAALTARIKSAEESTPPKSWEKFGRNLEITFRVADIERLIAALRAVLVIQPLEPGPFADATHAIQQAALDAMEVQP
jgi:hypothetical protein